MTLAPSAFGAAESTGKNALIFTKSTSGFSCPARIEKIG